MAESVTGVLAMQGAYAKHRESFARCGELTIEVRTLQDLRRCERLAIPGGESTTMYRLLLKANLWQPLLERVRAGMPMFGTCAGMILLSRHVVGQDRRSIENYGEQPCLNAMNLEVQRNAYGRQIASFSAELNLREQRPENPDFAALVGEASQSAVKLPLIFIRAPQAVSWGPEVQVLLRYREQAVCLQQARILVCSFHPELSDSTLLHQYFLNL